VVHIIGILTGQRADSCRIGMRTSPRLGNALSPRQRRHVCGFSSAQKVVQPATMGAAESSTLARVVAGAAAYGPRYKTVRP